MCSVHYTRNNDDYDNVRITYINILEETVPVDIYQRRHLPAEFRRK